MIDPEYPVDVESLSSAISKSERIAITVGALGAFVVAGTVVWGVANYAELDKALNGFLIAGGAILGGAMIIASEAMHNRAIDPSSYSRRSEIAEPPDLDQ